ncbi:BlaI/MecI/CopY family transcriptional regulator [Aquimarina gracilis]|uniref:BlaI/MecI/CopY family transcriptional regulator n=1 Tax=Aquimarina gracilis TaxID=874422 RepID=A0ABU5ZVG2_9FLAO|nr:BlaI/MecI/CopY family transcriptional regulator [Aquimarina gracilis]MEB3345873.1 BlaI/MecI/CopY family transcriptional regulator [Aquimarina gracilis]
MQKLAKREEQIMHSLWKLEKAFIKEIIEELPDPKPHYNTTATIVKILEEKGFISHVKYGNTFQYYPLITKEVYQKEIVGEVVNNYFDSSPLALVKFFAKEEKINTQELEEIIQLIKNKK